MLLLPRSEPTLAATVQFFAAAGVDCYGLAISRIERRTCAMPFNAEAIILTSANAVNSVPPAGKRLPVYAVGEATQKLAEAAGCNVVLTGLGGAAELAPQLPKNLHYWHPHAQNADVTWHADFELNITASPAYVTDYIESLPAALTAAWPQLTAVALFSPKSAVTLLNLTAKQGLTLPRCLCFSQNVAAVLADDMPRSICDSPRLDSMLECWHEFQNH